MIEKNKLDRLMNNLSLKNFKHYIGSIQQIRSTFFDSSNNLKNEFITALISGHSGCGKSTIIRLLFDFTKNDILYVSTGSYASILQLKNKVKYFCTFESVLCFFEKKPKLILFDDIDIHMNNDRYFTSFLKDLLKNKKEDLGYNLRCPIICVINANAKKLQDVRQSFHSYISFRRLSFNQCFQIIDDCISSIVDNDEENPIDYVKLTKLIKDNDNDLRTVINHLDEITENTPNDDIEISYKKKDGFLDASPSELAKLLLSKKSMNEECIKQMIVRDTNQISCVVHENYYKNFNNTSGIDENELMLVSDLNKAFFENELMISSSYDTIDTTLWDVSSHNKLTTIDYLSTQHENELIPSSLDFSQMINKQSLALNFNKKLVKMEQNMNIYKSTCIFPFMYIYYVISNLETQNVVKLITKNEFEIIQRFISDFMPSKKNSFSRVKTCFTK